MNNYISLVIAIIGCIVGVYGLVSNRDKKIKKETENKAREYAALATKLDYISKGVDDIRLDIKAQDNKISSMDIRVTKVEESCKSAHHRLDTLEGER